MAIFNNFKCTYCGGNHMSVLCTAQSSLQHSPYLPFTQTHPQTSSGSTVSIPNVTTNSLGQYYTAPLYVYYNVIITNDELKNNIDNIPALIEAKLKDTKIHLYATIKSTYPDLKITPSLSKRLEELKEA